MYAALVKYPMVVLYLWDFCCEFERIHDLNIYMFEKDFWHLFNAESKTESGRQRCWRLFEMGGLGVCSSKTFRPGYKPFPFLLCPTQVLIHLDSFLSISLELRTFSKCCSEKCQNYSPSPAFLLLHQTKYEEVAHKVFPHFNYSMHSNVNQVLKSSNVQWTRQTFLIHFRNRMLLEHKLNCSLRNVFKSLLEIDLLFCSQSNTSIEWVWNKHSVMKPAKHRRTSAPDRDYYKYCKS